MILKEYFTKYLNQPIDYDGFYGDQCMDNFLQYNQDVVGAPRVWGDAIDVPTTYPKDYYEWVQNSPTNFPIAGDVAIFDIGEFGHIAIVKEADVNQFMSLDQNWDGHQYCEYISHNYDNVIGWLHPKKDVNDSEETATPAPSDQALIDELRSDRDKWWNDRTLLLQAIDSSLSPTSAEVVKQALVNIQTVKRDLESCLSHQNSTPEPQVPTSTPIENPSTPPPQLPHEENLPQTAPDQSIYTIELIKKIGKKIRDILFWLDNHPIKHE